MYPSTENNLHNGDLWEKMATSMKLFLGWTGIHGLPRRISCFCGNIINSSMHTIQICRHTQWLVSSSNLVQQVFSTNCCHMHLSRPRVYILASTQRHGTQTNTLHADKNRKYRSVFFRKSSEDSNHETLFSRDFKQLKLLSHNISKSHFCSLWTKQNGCNYVHLSESKDTQMRHHFSTKASYSTLKGAGIRRDNQSPCSVTFDTQMHHHFSTKASYATLEGAGIRKVNQSPSSVTFDTQMHHHFSTKASYATLEGAGMRRDNQSPSSVTFDTQMHHNFSTKSSYAILKGAGIRRDNQSLCGMTFDTQMHHHFSTKASYSTLKGTGIRRVNQSLCGMTFDTQMHHHFSTKASYTTLEGAGMRRDNQSLCGMTFDTQMHHHFSTKASYAILEGAGRRRDNQSPCSVYCRMQAYGSSASDETGDPLSPKSPQFRCYMEHLRKEHQSISETLQGGEPVSDSKQKELRGSIMELGAVLDKWQELLSTEEEIAELQHLIQDSDQDEEMKELAASEKAELEGRIVGISQELIDLLMPSEETDDNDVIMEFSPGVGGQEAMLFAADMFEMYQRYATYRGWRFDVLEYYTTDMGGLRHASVSISGDQAYRFLRQEAGVHRVQRVPKTESKGRIHTSTMAVAVLPQPKEIDLKLDPKDLRIETKKASGAGGQHVNTTDSAVRITHLPTGISAESQQERSQHKNRAIAMTMLQTRIYNRILEEQASSERSLRSSQVGSGGRSEKIRTYNYQQDRITDHRIGRSVHGVTEYLLGSDMLDQMVLTCMEGEECQNLKERILEVYDKKTSSL